MIGEELRWKHRVALLRRYLAELSLWRLERSIALTAWNSVDPSSSAVQARDHRLSESFVRQCQITVPSDWKLDQTRLEIRNPYIGILCLTPASSESSASSPVGQLYRLSTHHTLFSLPSLASQAKVTLWPYGPEGQYCGDQAPWICCLAYLNEPVIRYERSLRLLVDSLNQYSSIPLWEKALLGAERSLRAIRWPSDTRRYLQRVSEIEHLSRVWDAPKSLLTGDKDDSEEAKRFGEACEFASSILSNILSECEVTTAGSVQLFGYAHVDPMWMWPESVSSELLPATFSTSLHQLETYPEFTTGQSSAALYRKIQIGNPPIFHRVTEMVRADRWSLLGGMWSEPDCNLVCGESLVRQGLQAQVFFRKSFGRRSTIAWLPDSFGFPGTLPQILKGLGLNYFYTAKLHLQDHNPFPYTLFWWRGIDGTQVLTYAGVSDDGYNGQSTALSLMDSWRQHHARSRIESSFQPLGYTGEAGPSDEDIERIKTVGAVPTLPRAEFGTPEQYFSYFASQSSVTPLPVWNGELYLERHRGSYTTQARTKYWHRRAEERLLTAEVTLSLNSLAGLPHDADLGRQWETLLVCEAHDVLAGTSIHMVHQDAQSKLRGVAKTAHYWSMDAVTRLAEYLSDHGRREGAVLVVNPRLFDQSIRLVLKTPFPGSQRSGNHYLIATTSRVPGLAAMTLEEKDLRLTDELGPVTASINGSELVIESSRLLVRIDSHGSLIEIRSKGGGPRIETRSPGALVLYDDRPVFWDAWELDASYPTRLLEAVQLQKLDLVEIGPQRVSVRLEFIFRSSKIIQYVRVWRNSFGVEFDTIVDWHERRCLLRTEFLANMLGPVKMIAECAFGVTERTLSGEGSLSDACFEVPGRRFAALESNDGTGGFAIVTESKYGYSARKKCLGLSLLRGPVFPDAVADEGRHRMRYELYPYSGSWAQSELLMDADAMNSGVIWTPCAPVNVVWKPLSFEGIKLGFGALKKAENGDGMILRTFEPFGKSGRVAMSVMDGWTAREEVNLLEEKLGQAEWFFRPFEIHSWRITK